MDNQNRRRQAHRRLGLVTLVRSVYLLDIRSHLVLPSGRSYFAISVLNSDETGMSGGENMLEDLTQRYDPTVSSGMCFIG